ncbi:MAG: DEAD/DEAH box helicase [Chthoniobacter sp.]
MREIFSETGLLAKAKNFEYRPEQQEMAVAVATALSEQRHLVVEAGTGVGKSLAYLVPAVLWALEKKKKAVISTYTINLQEQLVYKDIPIVQKVLPVEFEVMLWKGRANYLCPLRLERAVAHAQELFTSPEQSELTRIWEWAQTTQDGTLLRIFPWSRTRRCGRRYAASSTSARRNPAGRIRSAFTSGRANG